MVRACRVCALSVPAKADPAPPGRRRMPTAHEAVPRTGQAAVLGPASPGRVTAPQPDCMRSRPPHGRHPRDARSLVVSFMAAQTILVQEASGTHPAGTDPAGTHPAGTHPAGTSRPASVPATTTRSGSSATAVLGVGAGPIESQKRGNPAALALLAGPASRPRPCRSGHLGDHGQGPHGPGRGALLPDASLDEPTAAGPRAERAPAPPAPGDCRTRPRGTVAPNKLNRPPRPMHQAPPNAPESCQTGTQTPHSNGLFCNQRR